MSWEDVMRRVLPPIGGLSPHPTSAYGATNRPRGSTNPHRGVDFNYNVGPNGQRGINLQHPALRSPVDGIVTNAGQGTAGRIAIRDADGRSHGILHTHKRHVAIGDPVVAGQLIGTMGNTGVRNPYVESGDHHLHYQLKDVGGNRLNPSAFWDQQGPADPNPAPPGFLGEYQQYLRGLGPNAGSTAPMNPDDSRPFGTRGQFLPGSASSSRPLYETRSFVAPSDEPARPETKTGIRR
ncbi:MAG: M23 family metallopeptidase [Pseudomonadota bacterium]